MTDNQTPPEGFDLAGEQSRESEAAAVPGIVAREGEAPPCDPRHQLGTCNDDDFVEPGEQDDVIELATQTAKDF